MLYCRLTQARRAVTSEAFMIQDTISPLSLLRDEDFVAVRSLRKVSLEFTTRCNLKCTYCGVTDPAYIKQDMNLEHFGSLIEQLLELGVKWVQISGAGETTIVKNWDDYLFQLIDAGFKITIISNLAKPIPDRAIAALSRCKEITTSVDTADAELFAKIRTGGDLRVLLHNILRIRSTALMEGREAPRIIWNCVTNDKIVFDVERWVATGISVGVDHFQMSELTVLENLPVEQVVAPISRLSRAEIARARECVQMAEQLAAASGKTFVVLQAVQDLLNGERRVVREGPTHYGLTEDGKLMGLGWQRFVEILDDNGNPVVQPNLVTAEEVVSAAPASSAASNSKMTKDCVLPWLEMMFWANNQVSPCCMYGGLAEYRGDVQAALDAPTMAKVRRGLVTGHPEKVCEMCPMFEAVETDVLKERLVSILGLDGTAHPESRS